MTEQEMQSALEAMIYAADEPATLDQLVAAITGERPQARGSAPQKPEADAGENVQTPEETAANAGDQASFTGNVIPITSANANAGSDSVAREQRGAQGESRAALRAEVRAALDRLVASYAADERGIEIRKVAGGWKMYTKPQHHEAVRRFIKNLRPPVRLTMPALETLSVIAYKQPATLPEINEIRGVNCGGVVKTLLERRLITTAGRKEAVGRPILYRTSKDFLMRFGLADLEELPSLKEFEQLAQQALGADEGIAPVEPEESSAGFSGTLRSDDVGVSESAVLPLGAAGDASSSVNESSQPEHVVTESPAESSANAEPPTPESKAAGSSG